MSTPHPTRLSPPRPGVAVNPPAGLFTFTFPAAAAARNPDASLPLGASQSSKSREQAGGEWRSPATQPSTGVVHRLSRAPTMTNFESLPAQSPIVATSYAPATLSFQRWQAENRGPPLVHPRLLHPVEIDENDNYSHDSYIAESLNSFRTPLLDFDTVLEDPDANPGDDDYLMHAVLDATAFQCAEISPAAAGKHGSIRHFDPVPLRYLLPKLNHSSPSSDASSPANSMSSFSSTSSTSSVSTSTSSLSLPSPSTGSSSNLAVASTGPLRTQRHQARITNLHRKLGNTTALSRTELCTSTPHSRVEINKIVADVQHTLDGSRTEGVCMWQGCGKTIKLDGLRKHLRSTHQVLAKVGEMVQCRWHDRDGHECTHIPMRADGLAKHLRTVGHLGMKLTCPMCMGTFARRDGMRNHFYTGEK
ncbi:hypothetical protein C8R46DRAFT_1027505 [Mycena filopes]|nr:hypothetical protein C8R46DRAFT_1027505 [Mycena filopes]